MLKKSAVQIRAIVSLKTVSIINNKLCYAELLAQHNSPNNVHLLYKK